MGKPCSFMFSIFAIALEQAGKSHHSKDRRKTTEEIGPFDVKHHDFVQIKIHHFKRYQSIIRHEVS